MANLKTCVIQTAIYNEGDHPVWGDSAFKVEILDDGAGPYLKLNSFIKEPEGVVLGFAELEKTVEVAKAMLAQYEEAQDATKTKGPSP